ncbi:ATP-dependent Clp protease proteolytic subunit, partial [Candidatus Pacearchaeota archaeon]|nr:ATP-dependent Clp protease proteolytic subunit [Candidatus Pacearchaeota archaeon]
MAYEWLEKTARERLERAEQSMSVSAEQTKEFIETSCAAGDTPRMLATTGSNAEINIKGVLTNEPDFMARFFGGGNSTYKDIIQSIVLAEQDDNVKTITLKVDSPGGAMIGMVDAMDAIANATKPITAVVSGEALSAAYGLVSQAGTIIAVHEMVTLGSVGVAAKLLVSDSVVEIASTKAPEKRPDVTTEEGKADVRKFLDSAHDVFVSRIASG